MTTPVDFGLWLSAFLQQNGIQSIAGVNVAVAGAGILAITAVLKWSEYGSWLKTAIIMGNTMAAKMDAKDT